MGKWNMKWRWAYFGAARDARTMDLGGMFLESSRRTWSLTYDVEFTQTLL